ncbi:PRKR-interacting protein 1, partial [Clarias magur]
MAASQKEPKQGKPSKKESQPLIIAKTPAEEQRLKLEKLMRNPDKPAPVPERPKEWSPRAAPEFVRDVMGSSAGAGSGEFHVYRHLRRREYQRQDFLDRLSEKQKLDEDYQEKIKENQMAADERTAKRRKKREKLKQKKLMAKKAKQQSKSQEAFVNSTPTLAPNLAVPVTTNSVYLQKPFCYFDNVTCGAQGPCNVWLAAALSSAKGTFDTDKIASDIASLTSYPTTFNPGQKNYFVTQVGLQNNLHCTNAALSPTYFQVGASGACTGSNCNGVLPSGSTMSFKYFLANSTNSLLAESNWSNNITVNTLQSPGSLGSGYAGRSGAMVVITTILSIAAALLLLALLAFLIMA